MSGYRGRTAAAAEATARAKTTVPTSAAAAAAGLAPLALLVRNPLAVLLGTPAGRRFRTRGGGAVTASPAFTA